MNEKKAPPFFLEIEGFEAGHSAAESLTNSAQTAACEPSENGGFMHRASGLRVECPENVFADAPFIVMNAGRGAVTVNHLSRRSRAAARLPHPLFRLLLAGGVSIPLRFV